MATDKLGLPKITGNMTADVVRDLNALADAVDEKAGQAGGLATLGADGKVPAGQLNVDTSNLATKTELTTGLSGKVDKVEGKQLSTEDYTTAEKSKLAGIEAGANKYTHPSTHPASMITESTSRRFVSDAKIAEWDGKETPTGAQAKVDALAGAGNTRTVKQIGDDLDAHKAESTQQAHLAKNIGLEDIAGNFTSTELEGAMSELFTNVSNGKSLVGGAITDVDDSVVIPTDPTFQQLADAIGQISTGKKWASGTIVSKSNYMSFKLRNNNDANEYHVSFDMTTLDFVPSFIIFTFTDKGWDRISVWSYERLYDIPAINNYGNSYFNARVFRCPYISGVVNIPVDARNYSYNWFAVE